MGVIFVGLSLTMVSIQKLLDSQAEEENGANSKGEEDEQA